MGIFWPLEFTLVGGATFGIIAIAFDDDPQNGPRNVYIVTSDIQYSGLNFTQSFQSFVNALGQNEIVTTENFVHWSIQVGDGEEAWFFEIMSESFRKDQELVVKRWSEAEKNAITTQEMIGLTSLENSQISAICDKVIKLNPQYHLLLNNCKDFIVSTVKEICNVEQTMEETEEEAFAKMVAAHILFPIVGPAALVPMILSK